MQLLMKNIRLILSIFLFFAAIPLAQAAPVVDNKAEGKRLCQLGRYSEAKPFLEKAIRQNESQQLVEQQKAKEGYSAEADAGELSAEEQAELKKAQHE